MSPKFIINLLVAVAGGFLVVASRTFTPGTAGWLALGVGILAVALALGGLVDARLRPQAIGYVATAVVGAWTIVSSLVFNGSTLGWLVFADAAALVAIALAELTAHEVTTEHVVHTLAVSHDDRLQTV
jgi:hypothetical protein